MSTSTTISCEKSSLRTIRSFVSEKLESLFVSGKEANLIVLAVEEACSNIIIHSNKCRSEKSLQLEIDFSKKDSIITIILSDEGDFFDYTSYTEPTLESLVKNKSKGSLGLMLVRRIMDEIDYKTTNGKNYCTLKKKVELNYLPPMQ